MKCQLYMDFSTIYQAGYNPSLWVGFFYIFQCEVKENMADYNKKLTVYYYIKIRKEILNCELKFVFRNLVM